MKTEAFGGRKHEVEFLIGAMRESLTAGGEYLANRRYPNGPLCHERNLDYYHKTLWGMYAGGVDYRIIGEILDWIAKEALQPSGDFFFPEEEPQYQVMQRVYRPLNFLRVAAWIGHPLVKDRKVLERIFQYQHWSGGVFNYIGEDPAKIEPRETLGTLNTSFFGHLMLQLDERERAKSAGDFLAHFLEANREHMGNGCFYTVMDTGGELMTDVGPGQRYGHIVTLDAPKCEFWQMGTSTAYLAVLYEAMRDNWGYSAADAQKYLDAAMLPLAFESAMPLETYLWPSKCKAGWGAGELLRVLVKYGLGDAKQIEDLYQVGRKVAVHTFMGNQMPNGSWSAMHYPFSEDDPEYEMDYVPVRGRVLAPQHPVPGVTKLWLPGEELSGEFLGEMKTIEEGFRAYRNWLG